MTLSLPAVAKLRASGEIASVLHSAESALRRSAEPLAAPVKFSQAPSCVPPLSCRMFKPLISRGAFPLRQDRCSAREAALPRCRVAHSSSAQSGSGVIGRVDERIRPHVLPAAFVPVAGSGAKLPNPVVRQAAEAAATDEQIRGVPRRLFLSIRYISESDAPHIDHLAGQIDAAGFRQEFGGRLSVPPLLGIFLQRLEQRWSRYLLEVLDAIRPGSAVARFSAIVVRRFGKRNISRGSQMTADDRRATDTESLRAHKHRFACRDLRWSASARDSCTRACR